MKKVIGICGLIGHGKDTAAGFLIAEGYQRISFAGVLKDACANIFGWDRILLEGNTQKVELLEKCPTSGGPIGLGLITLLHAMHFNMLEQTYCEHTSIQISGLPHVNDKLIWLRRM